MTNYQEAPIEAPPFEKKSAGSSKAKTERGSSSLAKSAEQNIIGVTAAPPSKPSDNKSKASRESSSKRGTSQDNSLKLKVKPTGKK
jgi:hypothetical protein